MAQMTAEQAFALAYEHHRAGRFDAAERIYRQVVAQQPHAGALHHLGVLAYQADKNDLAIQLIRRSIELKPDFPEAYSNLANALAAGGQPDEAIEAYRQALALKPDFADALNNLANVLSDVGQLDEAVNTYRRAIVLRPDYADAYINLGALLTERGLLDEAIAACWQAVTLNSSHAEAHFILGNALSAKGFQAEAAAAYRQALVHNPDYAKALIQLATVTRETGHLDEAIESLQNAIALAPSAAEVHASLGNALKEKGRLDEAIAAYQRAIELKPRFPEALCNLGVVFKETGRLAEAVAAIREAIAIKPQFPEAYCNLASALIEKRELDDALSAARTAASIEPAFSHASDSMGVILTQKGELDEAIAAFRHAIELKPNFPEAYNNLGDSLYKNGQVDEAIAALRTAIDLKPAFAEAHSSLGVVLLANGNFDQGWDEYEWRFKCGQSDLLPALEQPLWDGGPLRGRTILLYAEQGLGDTLQFIRYVKMVADRGCKVLIGCPDPLVPLLQNLAPAAAAHPAKSFDVRCPLLSLPRIFKTNQNTIPAQVPYLRADEAKIAGWRRRLSELSGGDAAVANVGLAWAGNPHHKNDRARSTTLAALAPLAKVPRVRFFSLQKGLPASQAKSPPGGLDLVDWSEEFEDFNEAAALIANLDLIVTVDTSVAHLAGAVGRPVWVLLPFVPDWRWMRDRDDSPWYPTMRLFRQPQRGDWRSVIERVTESLANWKNQRS